MLTVEKYIHSIEENLQQYSQSLVSSLQQIRDYHFALKIDILDFTVFINPFVLSLTLFSMDKEANEVFPEEPDEKIFAGSQEILVDIPYYDVPESELQDLWDFVSKHSEEISEMEKQTITKWFVEC